MYHLQGDLKRAEQFFNPAEELTQNHPTFTIKVLCSRPGLQHWELLLNQIESGLQAGKSVAAQIKDLTLRLDKSEQFNRQKHVARVTKALTSLARGSLALLCATYGISMGSTSNTPESAALKHFAEAIDTFRACQHSWMLPQVLLRRAKLFREVFQDPRAASLDLDEAKALADGLNLPQVKLACAIEAAKLHANTETGAAAAQHGRELLR